MILSVRQRSRKTIRRRKMKGAQLKSIYPSIGPLRLNLPSLGARPGTSRALGSVSRGVLCSLNAFEWTPENRPRYDRGTLHYPSDLTDEEWSWVEPRRPPAKRGGRRREVDVRRKQPPSGREERTKGRPASIPMDTMPGRKSMARGAMFLSIR